MLKNVLSRAVTDADADADVSEAESSAAASTAFAVTTPIPDDDEHMKPDADLATGPPPAPAVRRSPRGGAARATTVGKAPPTNTDSDNGEEGSGGPLLHRATTEELMAELDRRTDKDNLDKSTYASRIVQPFDAENLSKVSCENQLLI